MVDETGLPESLSHMPGWDSNSDSGERQLAVSGNALIGEKYIFIESVSGCRVSSP